MSEPPRQMRLWLAWREAQERPKRKRGAQMGNRNAFRHGARTAVAIVRERELSALLAEIKAAIDCAKPFLRKRDKRTKFRMSTNK